MQRVLLPNYFESSCDLARNSCAIYHQQWFSDRTTRRAAPAAPFIERKSEGRRLRKRKKEKETENSGAWLVLWSSKYRRTFFSFARATCRCCYKRLVATLRSRRRLKDRIRIQFHSRRYSASSPLSPACIRWGGRRFPIFLLRNIPFRGSCRPSFRSFELRSIIRVRLLLEHVISLCVHKKNCFSLIYRRCGSMRKTIRKL